MEKKSNESQEARDEYAQEPIATGLMRSGVFDKAAFDAAYGSGRGGRNQEYGFRFAYALATQAAAAIAAGGGSAAPDDNQALPQAVARLGAGIVKLDDETLTFAMDYFKAKTLEAMPSWAGRVPRRPAGAPAPAPRPLGLGFEAKQAMARAVSSIDALGSKGMSRLIDALSDGVSSGRVPEMLTRAQALSQRSQIAEGAAAGKRDSGAPRI